MEDLHNMTEEDIFNWYKNWYAPNNATAVIVGDIDFDETFKMVEKYYGSKKRVDIQKRIQRNEPVQFGEKNISIIIERQTILFNNRLQSAQYKYKKYRKVGMLCIVSIIRSLK
jgi:predicted Zn-dependent peptidase